MDIFPKGHIKILIKYAQILKGLFVIHSGEVYKFCTNVVGNFYIVGKTLWGSKKSTPQGRIAPPKFPTTVDSREENNLPHSAYQKFAGKILRSGAFIVLNYHQTSP